MFGKSFGVNFINVKRAPFLYEHLFSSYVLALNELSYKKRARITLMKLTAGALTDNFSQVAFVCDEKRLTKQDDYFLVVFFDRCQFCQCFTCSFYARRSRKHKKILVT